MCLTFEEQKRLYYDVNNKFKKSIIYHVGVEAGFHSEVDAMMQCMLWCYKHEIKFILYADDANFAGGNGWNEFFESFCEENHDDRNNYANGRYRVPLYHGIRFLKTLFIKKSLKREYHVDFFTSDIFKYCIDRKNSTTEQIEWEEFGIDGCTLNEFGKISSLALKYNQQTRKEIEKLIATLNLPMNYVSIQFRGGDKIMEFEKLMNVDETCKKITQLELEIKDLFVFTDDYKYVSELKIKKPEWNIYTLTKPSEKGYYNTEFNKIEWSHRRKEMIKLFAMIDICLSSKMHLGCEQTCVNNYIKSLKKGEEYCAVQLK